MLLPAPPLYPRKRKARPRRNSSPPPPPVALAVVGVEGATFVDPDGECTVVFNTTAESPINDVAGSDPAKWTVRFGGVVYVATVMTTVAFDRVYLQFVADDSESGPNAISYSNAPSDVGDALGRQLAAFADFPV